VSQDSGDTGQPWSCPPHYRAFLQLVDAESGWLKRDRLKGLIAFGLYMREKIKQKN